MKKVREIMRVLAGLALAIVTPAVGTPASARDLAIAKPILACEKLAESEVDLAGELPARIVTARVVAGENAPYCEVRGYVASHVKFELRLPTENWTQRLLYSGCGGFCGRVDFRLRAGEGCVAVENGEFATVASDLGHDTPDGNRDTVWAAGNRQAKIDYGYRGVHVVTLAAKAIVQRFYGRPQSYAYFNGCSDGGREGLMEVQRYPLDYNGVVAGASVIRDTINNTLFHAWVARNLLRPDGTAMFSKADLSLLHAAALTACDPTADGLRDGVVGDPEACRFDPAVTLCASTKNDTCLSPDQVAAAKAIYQGPVDPRDRPLYYGRPVGSEMSWDAGGILALVEGFVRNMSADEPQPFDLKSISYDQASIEKYDALAPVYNATDPDIHAFQRAGGKLIMWHGWADPGVPPMSSVDYYKAVRRRLGSQAGEMIRLYKLPGVGHCGGGDGPDRLNLVDAITAWVEDGKAPAAIEVERKSYGRLVQKNSVLPYRDPEG